nr:MAG TPA: hypothetical protein [Caudoviricetes sp.]
MGTTFTFTEGICEVTVRRPDLTPEERAARMKDIERAAAGLLRAYDRQQLRKAAEERRRAANG